MRTKWIYLFAGFFLSLVAIGQRDSALVEGPIGMTVDQFNTRVKSTSNPLLVYFSANWCVVCKRQRPVLDQVMLESNNSIELLCIDMESNPLIADYFEVDALPALILYKDGYMMWNRVGFQEKDKIMLQVQDFLKKK